MMTAYGRTNPMDREARAVEAYLFGVAFKDPVLAEHGVFVISAA
jgi:hypothetical protein